MQRLVAATPSRCAVCGAWPAEPVCGGCVQRFIRARPRCVQCALPVPGGVGTCGRCLREPPPLDRCIAAVDYRYPWDGLVTQFKFHDQPGWAAPLAQLLRSAPGADALVGEADLVVSMPLARERLARRGFNQALAIARRLAPARTEAGLLLRLRDTTPQAALDRKQREVNVRGAFAVDPLQAARVRGRQLLIVDDVMTSGASLYAAARVLREAGAAGVSALVIARTEEPD